MVTSSGRQSLNGNGQTLGFFKKCSVREVRFRVHVRKAKSLYVTLVKSNINN